MSPRLLVLGVLALAAFGIAPAGASAVPTDLYLSGGELGEPELGAAEYPADVDAERYEEGPIVVLSTPAGDLTCEDVSLGQIGQLDEPEASFYLWGGWGTAGYSGCTFAEEIPTVIDSNGCQFVYDDFAYIDGPAFTADAEISCTKENEIHLSMAEGLCQVDIPAQTLNQTTDLTNTHVEGSEQLNAVMSGSELSYNVDPEGFCGLIGLKSGAHEDGSMDMDMLVQDVFMVGGSPKLEAAKYPTTVTGHRYEEFEIEGPLHILDPGNGETFSCNRAEVDGGTLTAPAYELDLTPEFSECEWYGSEEPELDMNSCSYFIPEFQYHAGEGNYRYDPEIKCGEGDSIEIGLGGLCTLSIPPQTLHTEYINVAINKESQGIKDIALAILGENVEYIANPGFCELLGISEGAHEDGETAFYYRIHG